MKSSWKKELGFRLDKKAPHIPFFHVDKKMGVGAFFM
jgi:hypothetical protein